MKTDEFVRTLDTLVPGRELKERVMNLEQRARRARLERPGRLLAAFGAAAAVCACAAVCVLLLGPGGTQGAGSAVSATGAQSAGIASTQSGAAATQRATDNVPGDIINILILGTDTNAERAGQSTGAHTDCVMLASIHTATKQISLLSIPRDTYVRIYDGNNKEVSRDRINAAFLIGGGLEKDGIDYAVNTMRQYLGGSVPIDHYALFDMDMVKELIDAVGGVNVDVDISLNVESAGVHLKPGKQKLNGIQALTYVRDRHNTKEGDIGRAGHQQQVIIALLDELQRGGIVTRIPELYQSFAHTVATDPALGAARIAELALIARDTDASAVKQYTLKVKAVKIDGMSVAVPDQENMKEIIKDVFGADYVIREDE